MLNKKVVKHMEQVLLYIKNRITVNTPIETVVAEVINNFKVELAFFDTSHEMLENFVETLCMNSYIYIHNKLETQK